MNSTNCWKISIGATGGVVRCRHCQKKRYDKNIHIVNMVETNTYQKYSVKDSESSHIKD